MDIEVSDEVVVKWEIKWCDNAVAVLNEDGERIGYLPRGHNEDVARLMDQGLGFRVGVMDVGALNHRCPSMTIVLILREPVPADNGLIEIVD